MNHGEDLLVDQRHAVRDAAAGIIVLLLLLLTMNSVAVVLRDRFQKVRS